MNYNTSFQNSIYNQNKINSQFYQSQPQFNNNYQQFNSHQTPLNYNTLQLNKSDDNLINNNLFFVGGSDIAPTKNISVPEFNKDNLLNVIVSNPKGIYEYVKNSLVEQKNNSKYIMFVISTILNLLNTEYRNEIIHALESYKPSNDNKNPPNTKYLLKIIKKKGFSVISLKNLLELETVLANDPKLSPLIKSALALSTVALQNMKISLPDLYGGILLDNFNGHLQTLFTFIDNDNYTNKIIAEFKNKTFNPSEIQTIIQEKISEYVPPPSGETNVLPKQASPKQASPKKTSPKKTTAQSGGYQKDKYFKKYIYYKTMYLQLKNNI